VTVFFFTACQVVDLINEAITAPNEKDKVKYLQQVQELVINQSDGDIMDNFLDEVIAFQSSKGPEVRKFVIGFLELACKKDGDCFPKLILNLKILIGDENANVAKRAIQAATQLYRFFLDWVIKSATVTDEVLSTYEVWTQIKEMICAFIDASENDGIKTQAIKFMEMLVILQTAGDQWSANDQAVPLDRLVAKQVTTPQDLEEEANRVFEQLVVLHGTVHVSSVNLMACMQSLVLIAKQRSHLFMGRVIQALEALHANLPPTLAKSQVNSVRKHLKMQLLTLLKHPAAATSNQHQTIIVGLLSDLGVLQPEMLKCISEVKKRGLRVDLVTPEAKKIKLEPPDKVKSAEQLPTPRISRSDAQSVIDVTSSELSSKLQVIENVTDLVLVSLLQLPDTMPSNFQAIYTPVSSDGVNAQIEHVSRLLATQLTAAGLGSGVQQFAERVSASTVQADQPVEQRHQQIQTLIGMMAQEVKKQEQHNEKRQQHEQQSRVKLIPTGKTVVTPVKLKHVSLSEITKELSPEDQELMICKAMDRILGKEEAGSLTMSSSQILQRQHIISRLCCIHRQSPANLFDQVVDYVLQDIRSRNDILLSILFEMFLQCKSTKTNLSEYEDCLLRILYAVIERTEVRDRDHFMAKILQEAPLLSLKSIDCLQKVIENENNVTSVEQCFTTLASLLKSRRVMRKELLSLALQLEIVPEKADVRQRALSLVRDLYQSSTSEVKQQIHSFSLDLLSNLSKEKPPDFLRSGDVWTEEPAKICLIPYLQLLSLSHNLIHGLATAYVSAPADVKRVILRSIETPVRAMGMNSPELLLLVENCPKGAETLVTRIIHVLTDKQQPSPELVIRVRDLYQRSGTADVRFLIPVLNGLTKKEVIAALPRLIKLNPVVVKEVFNRLLGIHYGE
jgi:symplekin